MKYVITICTILMCGYLFGEVIETKFGTISGRVVGKRDPFIYVENDMGTTRIALDNIIKIDDEGMDVYDVFKFANNFGMNEVKVDSSSVVAVRQLTGISTYEREMLVQQARLNENLSQINKTMWWQWGLGVGIGVISGIILISAF